MKVKYAVKYSMICIFKRHKQNILRPMAIVTYLTQKYVLVFRKVKELTIVNNFLLSVFKCDKVALHDKRSLFLKKFLITEQISRYLLNLFIFI